MFHNHFFTLLLISLSLSLICCDKEETFQEPNGRYYKYGGEAIGTMRVFSTQGEIKDKSVIDKFLKSDSSSYTYFFKNRVQGQWFMDSVQFFSSHQAKLFYEYLNLDCKVSNENGLLVLSRNEATNQCCFLGEVFTRSLQYYMGKVKPEVNSEFLRSSTNGYYIFGFNGRNRFVLEQSSSNKLTAPVVNFIIHTKGSYDSGLMNNELQNDFYKKIVPGDTITLMQFRILFNKE